MDEKTGRFCGADDAYLFYRYWHCDSAKAALVIIHGIGEHSERYQNVVDMLVPHGYSIYTFDLRGHGRSSGQRGHINSWDQYRADLAAFVEFVREKQSDCPLYLFGHSMGSLIVLDRIIRNPEAFSGLIVSGAAIEPTGVGNPFLILVARVLSGLMPRYSLPLGIDISALSGDQDVLENYRNDPLVHGKVTVRWGMESLRIIDNIKQHLGCINIPTLILHGANDTIDDPHGSEYIFEQISSEDKTLFIHPHCHHELHNDVHHVTVIEILKEWLDIRTNRNI
jgi:alpha-beta hydrolase superfamily lysophospholipase